MRPKRSCAPTGTVIGPSSVEHGHGRARDHRWTSSRWRARRCHQCAATPRSIMSPCLDVRVFDPERVVDRRQCDPTGTPRQQRGSDYLHEYFPHCSGSSCVPCTLKSWRSKRLGARNDFNELFGDVGLTLAVILKRQACRSSRRHCESRRPSRSFARHRTTRTFGQKPAKDLRGNVEIDKGSRAPLRRSARTREPPLRQLIYQRRYPPGSSPVMSCSAVGICDMNRLKLVEK